MKATIADDDDYATVARNEPQLQTYALQITKAVVPVLASIEVKRSNGTLFFAYLMPRYPETLSTYLEKKLTTEERKALCGKLTRAVQAWNELGMVHGDIKTLNVLVDLNGDVKFGDFGLASKSRVMKTRRRTDQTDYNHQGTCNYMGGETWCNLNWDPTKREPAEKQVRLLCVLYPEASKQYGLGVHNVNEFLQTYKEHAFMQRDKYSLMLVILGVMLGSSWMQWFQEMSLFTAGADETKSLAKWFPKVINFLLKEKNHASLSHWIRLHSARTTKLSMTQADWLAEMTICMTTCDLKKRKSLIWLQNKIDNFPLSDAGECDIDAYPMAKRLKLSV